MDEYVTKDAREVNFDKNRVYFFRVGDHSVLSIATNSRVNVRYLATKYSSYREALLSEPDAVQACSNVLRELFTLKQLKNLSAGVTRAVWFCGLPGAGKSSLARRILETQFSGRWYDVASLSWWQNCDQPDVVLMDEFRFTELGPNFNIKQLFALLDGNVC